MLVLRRWLILVFLNAPASFAAALATEHTKLLDIVEMIAGILTFVLVALAVDSWITRNGFLNLREALVTATKFKIGLQLLPVIEVGAGALAGFFVASLFQWPATGSAQMGRTYVMTVVTGAVLTIVVFLITPIVFYVRARKAR